MDALIPVDFKTRYLKLISQGNTEMKALAKLEVDWMDFFELCAIDPDFRANIDIARKARAEVWVNKIAQEIEPKMMKVTDAKTGEEKEVERIPGKDETAYKKLQFEQLKFLAKADNPERYGDAGGGKSTVEINLDGFKLLTPQEAIKTLNNDPFNKLVTIDAEITKE